MFQTTLTTEEEIIAHAKKLQERGARNVLVSMAKDGAILVTEDGEIYKKQPQKGTVVNSVGAGDSMVAGFLAGYLNTWNSSGKCDGISVLASIQRGYCKTAGQTVQRISDLKGEEKV